MSRRRPTHPLGVPAGGRGGFAIFLVVMLVAVVGTFAAIVIYHGSTTRRQTSQKLEALQAEFLAKSALQHFLLKFRLLPTEFYDATSYAVGKNPYFDFSLEVSRIEGNTFSSPGIPADGPMFFTGSLDRTQVTLESGRFRVNRSAEGSGIRLNPSAGFDGDPETNRHTMEILLNHYLLDVATDYPVMGDPNRSIVVVDSNPHRERARFGRPDRPDGTDFDPFASMPLTDWRDPFIGTYRMQGADLLGIGGADAGKKHQADSVLVTSTASVRREGQISLVTISEGAPHALAPPREMKRRLDASSSGWVELGEQLESWDEYQGRRSGKQSRIATGLFFISRQ